MGCPFGACDVPLRNCMLILFLWRCAIPCVSLERGSVATPFPWLARTHFLFRPDKARERNFSSSVRFGVPLPSTLANCFLPMRPGVLQKVARLIPGAPHSANHLSIIYGRRSFLSLFFMICCLLANGQPPGCPQRC